MEEIKVGDYVRTKKYGIARVDDIKHCIWLDRAIAADPCVPSYCFTIEEYKNIVKKHSSNIIDLIEVGDYVNGKLIHKVDIRENSAYIYYGNCKTFTDYEIKSIVTKEQFADMEYRLED